MPAPDLIRDATGVPAETLDRPVPGPADDRARHRAGDGRHPPGPGRGPGAPRVRLARGAVPVAGGWTRPTPGKVFLLPAVPPSELLAWTASADVMVMPIQPTTTNHEFTTPQKLWEAIAAGVPVVASDLPGMAEVVNDRRRRRPVRSDQPGIDRRGHPPVPRTLAARAGSDARARPRAAHERYNWESQLETLFGLYADLGAAPSVPDWRSRTRRIGARRPRSRPDVETRAPGPRLRFVQVPPPRTEAPPTRRRR